MNTQSNATAPPLGAQSVASADIPALRQFYSLVQREIWESRYLYIAPLAAAGLFLLGFVISMIYFPGRLRSALGSAELQHVNQPFDTVAVLIMGVTFLVAVFYCLDALYGERRDRSILFWKSLPVSDTTTVLSKASIPIVAVPLFALALTVATQLVMLVLSSAVIRGSGVTVLWSQLSLFHQWHILFIHLVTGHGLWYAPIYAYLLLISAWARRTPFLWATLPLVAVGGAERIAFNTSYLAAILGGRITGGPSVDGATAGTNMDAMTPFTLTQLVSSPGLWIGLLVAAAFLAGAIRLRRHRGPI
jgi:ABC-2 type transport system permease protein